MYKYHCLNPIAEVGLEKFSNDYVKTDCMVDADAVLVRSAVMHDMEFGGRNRRYYKSGIEIFITDEIRFKKEEHNFLIRRQSRFVQAARKPDLLKRQFY